MSKITSIASSLPRFRHSQNDLFNFANDVYANDETGSRKLKFLYHQSGIDQRYSVIPDYSCAIDDRIFYPKTADLEPFPTVDLRMKFYNEAAGNLSIEAIEKCIENNISKNEITHLITVSCTGMSAPGLDLHIIEAMELPSDIVRTSVNFMGCYAAVHAMKIADAFCKTSPNANVVVVCTELCTLHFQKENSIDNITASLLFADGCAAMLFQNDQNKQGIQVENFFSDISFKGKQDMAWEISSKGFLMTLTGFVPDLIREDFGSLVQKALSASGKTTGDVTHWCMHPGGKKILDSISKSIGLQGNELHHSYDVLKDFGNMSSATIVFVLEKILKEFKENKSSDVNTIFGVAFGPGLTMETFTASYG